MTRVLVVGARARPETFLDRLFAGLKVAGNEVLIGVDRVRELRTVPPPLTAVWLPARARGRQASLERLMWAIRHATLPSWRHLTVGRAERLAAIRRLGPDVIYFPWNGGAIADEALMDLGIPTVISCRGSHVLVVPTDDNGSAWAEGLRRTFAKATAVHCVSEHIATVAEGFGLDRAKTRVIRPAVDLRAFHPGDERVGVGPLRIVTTGSLGWRKGLEYSVVALSRLRSLGVEAELTLIGDGPDRQRVEYTAIDSGVARYITLVGRRSPAEVTALLRTADIFWLPSLEEGISNAALEAMACGLPVITTDAGGMSEAVTDGVEGFVVPRRDPSALAERTATLADHRGLRLRMGRAARARVERDFDLAAQVASFAGLLNDVAAIRAGRR